jgi:hypothetical protein
MGKLVILIKDGIVSEKLKKMRQKGVNITEFIYISILKYEI